MKHKILSIILAVCYILSLIFIIMGSITNNLMINIVALCCIFSIIIITLIILINDR